MSKCNNICINFKLKEIKIIKITVELRKER